MASRRFLIISARYIGKESTKNSEFILLDVIKHGAKMRPYIHETYSVLREGVQGVVEELSGIAQVIEAALGSLISLETMQYSSLYAAYPYNALQASYSHYSQDVPFLGVMFADKKRKEKPRPKIRGSQHRSRTEKRQGHGGFRR